VRRRTFLSAALLLPLSSPAFASRVKATGVQRVIQFAHEKRVNGAMWFQLGEWVVGDKHAKITPAFGDDYHITPPDWLIDLAIRDPRRGRLLHA
jgi:hypothetical protein